MYSYLRVTTCRTCFFCFFLGVEASPPRPPRICVIGLDYVVLFQTSRVIFASNDVFRYNIVPRTVFLREISAIDSRYVGGSIKCHRSYRYYNNIVLTCKRTRARKSPIKCQRCYFFNDFIAQQSIPNGFRIGGTRSPLHNTVRLKGKTNIFRKTSVWAQLLWLSDTHCLVTLTQTYICIFFFIGLFVCYSDLCAQNAKVQE